MNNTKRIAEWSTFEYDGQWALTFDGTIVGWYTNQKNAEQMQTDLLQLWDACPVTKKTGKNVQVTKERVK